MECAERLNGFLVSVFNEILKTEEENIEKHEDLSLREIHAIEAVCNAEDSGSDNRATAIADCLHITAGTLTTSVSLLEKKGYLVRLRDTKDKRVVRIHATDKGRHAKQLHDEFHHEMVANIMGVLSDEELAVFVKALENISVFFKSKYKKK